MNDVLSNLKIIDSSFIVLHENNEPTRLEKTKESIYVEGILRHPPIAVKMKSEKYLIIDGAHRTSSLQALGYYHIPLHIVETKELVVGTWDHIIPAGSLIEYIKNNKHIFIIETCLQKERFFAKIQKGSTYYYIYLRGSEEYLDVWHDIINFYQDKYAIIRVPSELEMELKPNTLRISYQNHTLKEIEEIVLQGKIMPAGVTRFEVSGRILNIQVPLYMLKNTENKSIAWENMINDRKKTIRYYSAPIYICES